jgi:hypothetical protein
MGSRNTSCCNKKERSLGGRKLFDGSKEYDCIHMKLKKHDWSFPIKEIK